MGIFNQQIVKKTKNQLILGVIKKTILTPSHDHDYIFNIVEMCILLKRIYESTHNFIFQKYFLKTSDFDFSVDVNDERPFFINHNNSIIQLDCLSWEHKTIMDGRTLCVFTNIGNLRLLIAKKYILNIGLFCDEDIISTLHVRITYVNSFQYIPYSIKKGINIKQFDLNNQTPMEKITTIEFVWYSPGETQQIFGVPIILVFVLITDE